MARGAAEIVAVPAEVRVDVARLRIAREHPVALRHQLLEARKAVLRILPAGKHVQLEPALVVEVHRRPELRGIGHVNQHRDVQPGAGLPDRVEIGVVHLEARAVGLARGQAEVLEDLQPDGAVLHALFDLRDRALLPARAAGALPVDVDEQREAIRVAAVADGLDRTLQPIAVAARQVVQDADVEAVHLLDQLLDVLGRDRGVVVDVDRPGTSRAAPGAGRRRPSTSGGNRRCSAGESPACRSARRGTRVMPGGHSSPGDRRLFLRSAGAAPAPAAARRVLPGRRWALLRHERGTHERGDPHGPGARSVVHSGIITQLNRDSGSQGMVPATGEPVLDHQIRVRRPCSTRPWITGTRTPNFPNACNLSTSLSSVYRRRVGS